MALERNVQGSSLLGIISFIENALDPAQRVKVKALISHIDPKAIVSTDFYPIERSNELCRAIASVIEDPNDRYQRFIECGEYIANDALSTFLRLLIKFLKPSLFARKYGDFFRRAHTFGTVEAKDFTDKGFVLEMNDVAGYDYVAPISIGWMKCTLKAMGCKNVRVKETKAPPSSPQTVANYRMEVGWS